VTFLAEEGDGRDNLIEGSRTVQDRLVEELEPIAQAVPGGDGFLHPFDQGTNVLGFIEGTEASSEVVVLGAHYDHLGHDCPTDTPGDDVCDGAGDNAAGVAAVLEIGRRLAADPPSRSVILALWDAEEDGNLGSIAAVQSGVLALDSVVAYLNWGIQGINLLPSLTDTTFVIGAETGGPALEDAVAAGRGSTDLLPVDLSLVFGQGRSDHATFADAGVPTAFFSDATSACYHTSQDDMEHLDLEKLARQIDLGETVVRSVAGTGARPTFVADTPAASFDDAESMLAMVGRTEADLDRYPAEDQAAVEQFLAALDAMVQDGEAAFSDDDANTLLAGTAALVELFEEGDCDGFLD
jgi:Peptidase family M28